MRFPFNVPPMVLNSLVSLVMKPYLALTFCWIVSNSGPATNVAVAWTTDARGLIPNRGRRKAARWTRDVWASCFALPEPELVQETHLAPFEGHRPNRRAHGSAVAPEGGEQDVFLVAQRHRRRVSRGVDRRSERAQPAGTPTGAF